MNRGSDKKGVFNFGCFGFVARMISQIVKRISLNFLKRSVLQSFSPKTQGFACKSGVIFEFWGVCMRLVKKLDVRSLLF
ncbi:hypothetical protein BGL75_03815 [Helicobacter pylori]|nr:hypothetical protein BGL75_03815 [Helicobacter pylori]